MVTTVQEKPEVLYLNQLLRLAAEASISNRKIANILQPLRDNAATWAKELAIPTKKDEDWRFTDLSSLLDIKFKSAGKVQLEAEAITPLVLPECDKTRLVFVDGQYAPNLSSVADIAEGVFVGNLEQIPADLETNLSHYLARQPGGKATFSALNTAALTDVAVVWVRKNKVAETPIHLLFISSSGETSTISHPRILVVAEPGSNATIVEHYATLTMGCSDMTTDSPYLTNTVSEIWLEENAELKHIRLQRDAGSAFHIGKTAISQARNSRYIGHAVSLGAKLSRHEVDVNQTGVATDTRLNSLTVMGNKQLADTHSALLLNHPHGTLNQIHKIILDDSAQGVFNGRVVVPQAAQLTNANQLSRNLLLSPKARVNTKPQLEITADDVKCSHGATISQLEEDELFYLRSRGLDDTRSRQLLIDAFAGEIINQLPLESLQQMLSRCVACRSF
ncbi:MAG: Fe-S cluster assembly protein SufD [Microcoleaceae cyanobacterium]